MTFALLRAGLPNSIVAAALALVPIVAIALAIVPIVALALAVTQQSPQARADVIAAAQDQPIASGNQAVPN